ncbi:uncharacterized protein MICPUCDRAFT_65810 [Micromonas pusilla CCMP1545]|uniref:Predicted protein n=1 Tax=Micromonas pusilla (strain CCMP1545) TaxID=564608 RepID=C1N6Y1_MICPC|nr:uncharacterized protein MICPUCDRAFT_65810 [Micromonas pusilla CCMP1545]EEH52183.1 predicted protein [Micromonas pusilla CCMP1545]|eukprot:XP_003063810.1 predicted protein [Micromonas pusilla CCMP1545]
MNASAVARIASAQLRDMFRVLSDDDTASGLLELLAANPAARDVAAAREDIEASAGWYVGLVETRRRTLLRRIAAYRREKDAAEKKKKNEGSGGDGARFAKTYATRKIVASTPPPGCGAEEEEDDDEEKDAAAAPPPPPPPPTIRVTVNMTEYEYDAGGVQELVFHDLTLTNVGDDPIALGLGRRGDRVVVIDRDDPRVRTRVTVVRPTFTFGFDPSVTFTGGSYAAWPNEFRVGCWSSAHGGGDDAESVASADNAPRADFDVASNCTATAAVTGPSRQSTRAGGPEPPVAMQVYATFSNRSVSLTFGGAERGDGVDGAPVVLCPGCAVTLGKVSFYQRFWSAFQRGIATLNLKGVPDVRVRLGDRCGGGGGGGDDARATTPVAGGRTYPTRRG